MIAEVIVNVVLPAYNAEATIEETIQSIINQTFSDWELIVINDGSTDNTKAKILSFNDPRIKYYENEGNKGLIYTLNRGIDLATGKYIARMDADDICMPERFEKQVAFMEKNSDVIICGTQIEYFGLKQGGYRKVKLWTDDETMKEQLAITPCFAHPTVMFRGCVLKQNKIIYNLDYKNAEDYKLWIDLMKFGVYANLTDVLLKYRVSDSQITQNNNQDTIKSERCCRYDYLSLCTNIEFAREISLHGVNINTLNKFKAYFRNKGILKNLYLSLDSYNFRALLYYLITLDFFKLGFKHNIMFMKRFISGKKPIYPIQPD